MNRRCFLSFLGLAAVAAALPAMALPRPDKPTDIEKLNISVDVAGNNDEVTAMATFRIVVDENGDYRTEFVNA